MVGMADHTVWYNQKHDIFVLVTRTELNDGTCDVDIEYDPRVGILGDVYLLAVAVASSLQVSTVFDDYVKIGEL